MEPHRKRIFRPVDERPGINGQALRTVLAGKGLVLSDPIV